MQGPRFFAKHTPPFTPFRISNHKSESLYQLITGPKCGVLNEKMCITLHVIVGETI